MPSHVELHGRFSNGGLELEGVIQPLGDSPQEVTYTFFGPISLGFGSRSRKSGSITTSPESPAVVLAHLRLPAMDTAGLAQLSRQRFRLDVVYRSSFTKEKPVVEFVSSTGEELFLAGTSERRHLGIQMSTMPDA